MEPENKEEKVREIYESLNTSERFGIRFGLFPHRIAGRLQESGVTEIDLMEYDERLHLGNR